MPPKPIAHALGTRREEATLLAQQRILSVRAHQPAIGSGLASNFNAVGRESGNSSPPAQIYAPCRRLLHQQLVQNHAPNPKSLARRECRFHGAGIIKEANAAKGKGLVRWNRDAESLERGQSIGHDALATSFIDRRTGAIDDRHIQSNLSRCYRGCQSGGTSAGHDDFAHFEICSHRLTSAKERVRSRTPDPSRPGCCRSRPQDAADS